MKLNNNFHDARKGDKMVFPKSSLVDVFHLAPGRSAPRSYLDKTSDILDGGSVYKLPNKPSTIVQRVRLLPDLAVTVISLENMEVGRAFSFASQAFEA